MLVKRGKNGRFLKGCKFPKSWLRKSLTIKVRKQISETLKSKKIVPPSRKGIKTSIEVRKKISQSLLNIREKNHFWKGGITSENIKIRHSFEYKIWRENVFKRDNWTCIMCGVRSQRGKKVILNADHIKSFSLIIRENKIRTIDDAKLCPELWDINNGRTLCQDCHKKTDTYLIKNRW